MRFEGGRRKKKEKETIIVKRYHFTIITSGQTFIDCITPTVITKKSCNPTYNLLLLKEIQNLIIWPKACLLTTKKNKVGEEADTLYKWVEKKSRLQMNPCYNPCIIYIV